MVVVIRSRTRKPPGIKATESEITDSIRSYLDIRGVFHWKNWGGPMSKAGVSDILGCYRGRMLAIEIKGPNGRLSDKQQAFIDRINEEDGLAFVATSVEDVIKKLEEV
jgi:hypothetical protein